MDNLNLYQNNTDKETVYYRDVFLKSEKDYVLELLKDPDVIRLIKEYNFEQGFNIFEKVENLLYQVDNNLIPEEEMETIEKLLIVLNAAIYDKCRVEDFVFVPSEYGMELKAVDSNSRVR